MIKEKDIVHENGNFWVLKSGNEYHVMRSGLTHSTGDSAYDSLDLAVARCNYLAKRAAS